MKVTTTERGGRVTCALLLAREARAIDELCFDLERGGRVARALLLTPVARALDELCLDLERGVCC